MKPSIPFDENRPAPIISLKTCDGCGLCILVCPNGALALQGGKAVVANPLACEYAGQCEAVCPVQAIARPFYIVPQANEKSSESSSLTLERKETQ